MRKAVTIDDALKRLCALQIQGLELLDRLDEVALRRQMHPDLSPLAWHVGHAVSVEVFWLREQAAGEAVLSEPERQLYFPENMPKALRSERLPRKPQLLDWAQHHQRACRRLWPRLLNGAHPLCHRDYLLHFILQHYAQHLETMHMILQAYAMASPVPAEDEPHAERLMPEPPLWRRHPGGCIRLSADPNHPAPYDNELPHHEVELSAFMIAACPVNNAEWLAFMQAGGYAQREFWSEVGWQYRMQQDWHQPYGWQLQTDDRWWQASPYGWSPLNPTAAVMGISWHEAQAYARWAGARLPNEQEWMAASQTQLLQAVGQVWEWCANPFFAYPGFRAFPYASYSQPWFDGAHYTLKGSSAYTQAEIQRITFRNFYQADKRHIFSGLRLARTL